MKPANLGGVGVLLSVGELSLFSTVHLAHLIGLTTTANVVYD